MMLWAQSNPYLTFFSFLFVCIIVNAFLQGILKVLRTPCPCGCSKEDSKEKTVEEPKILND